MKSKIPAEIFVDKNNVNNKVTLILASDLRSGSWYTMRTWATISKC